MTELDFIRDFLLDNRKYVQDKYAAKSGITVSTKAHASDLLTEVDLTIQKRFVERVNAVFPGDVVVGEEGEYARYSRDLKERAWVIDPIDGTYNFVRGLYPVFAISIAFTVDGENAAAGVLLPITGELLLSEHGAGSFCNGRRLRVSDVRQAGHARIDMDFSGLDDRRRFLDRGIEMLRQVGQLRCYGSAVASICQIATGDADGYVHMSLAPWDFAASQLIVEEAGGMATRLDGSPLRVFDPRQGILITNGAIHQEMLSLLRA